MQGTIDVWINAFIPRDVPNYTQTVAGGDTHGGKTAVPLPWLAMPLNPGKPWNEGYLTDQRGFSDQKGASSRMQSSASIDISPHMMKARVNTAITSGTIAVDIKSGKELDSGGADLSRCSASIEYDRRTNIITGDHIVNGIRSVIVTIVGAGSDPLVYASADIDYIVKFQIIHEYQNDLLKVLVKGDIDAFPAFEAYVSFNGQTQTLFTAPPPKNKTVVNLLGPANRPISGYVRWPMK